MNRALIPQLQALLEHAAQQQTADRAGSPRSAHPRARRVRRGALPGSLALLASATALAATHPWSPTLGGPHRGHPTTSTSPVPSTELRLLGVLRRPQTAADRAPAVQTTLRFLVAAEQHGVRTASIRNLGASPAAPDRAIIAFSLTHEGLTDGTVPGASNDVCLVFPVLLASQTSTITDAHGQPRTVTTYGGPAAAQSCGNAQQLQQGAIRQAARSGRASTGSGSFQTASTPSKSTPRPATRPASQYTTTSSTRYSAPLRSHHAVPRSAGSTPTATASGSQTAEGSACGAETPT